MNQKDIDEMIVEIANVEWLRYTRRLAKLGIPKEMFGEEIIRAAFRAGVYSGIRALADKIDAGEFP